MSALVQTEIDSRGVVTVTLNRPEYNNAYNGDMLQSLLDGAEALASDAAARVVVIRGAGKHFQAGADLKWLRSVAAQDATANIAASRLTALAVHRLCCLPLPTIALVQGACIGGGTGVAAACDVVIAANDAQFAISEARWGLAASIIFPHLNACMGSRQVRRYAQTCEKFDAVTAKRLGLVHEVCDGDALDEVAAPIIDHLLRAAPVSLRETKLGVLQCAGLLLSDDELSELIIAHANKRQSSEAKEGILSFLEKRDATWYPAQA